MQGKIPLGRQRLHVLPGVLGEHVQVRPRREQEARLGHRFLAAPDEHDALAVETQEDRKVAGFSRRAL